MTDAKVFLNPGEIQRLHEAFLAGARYGAEIMEKAWVTMHPNLDRHPYILLRRTDADQKFAQLIKQMETNLDLIERLKTALQQPEEQFRADQDLEMMKSPHLWPNHCCLYLKKFGDKEFGLLLEKNGTYSFVPETPTIEATTKPDFANKRTGGHELLVQLVQEGWFID
jgi:hypothetical protein